MSIPIVALEPAWQWDQTMLAQLLTGRLWPHDLDLLPADPWPDAPGIILVVPGRYWVDREPSNGHWTQINDAIAKYDWVIAFRVGDEEDWFDPKNIQHPNIRWWIQTPRTDHDYGDAHLFGVGFTPHCAVAAGQLDPPDKNLDVFIAAQNTHDRRAQCFNVAQNLHATTELIATAGFTQGLPPDEYSARMQRAKICLAPAGPVTPDTFRLYEALQMHAIPIADNKTPGYDANGYWYSLFPDAPFPTVDEWDELPAVVDTLLEGWPANANRVAAWWMREKQRMTERLINDVTSVIQQVETRSAVTAVIPVSPIISHPDIQVVEATIASIRWHLPDTEIIITFDGVRVEQEHMRADYEEAIRRILWRCDHLWKNVTPLIFDEHTHQVGMMRAAMQHIATPMVLYVEQDTPLWIDRSIDWQQIMQFIGTGDAGLIRFSHESRILNEHMHMMHGKDKDFTRTSQWSQRPHIASKAFYTRVLGEFTDDATCFIEDKMASVLECAFHDYGQLGWMQWPCWIYTPPGDIERSYHLDGRAGQPKYVDEQRY